MPTTRKRRITLFQSGTAYKRAYNGSSVTSNIPVAYQLLGTEEVISEGHVWPLPPGSKGRDSGGGFSAKKATHEGYPWQGKISNGPSPGVWYEYEGPIFAHSSYSTLSASDYVASSTDAQLNAAGSTMISRVLPTNPLSGMGQFLGELRDLPRVPDIKAWKTKAWNFYRGYASKRRISKAAADEYLNGVFGWLPFVKDLQDFSQAVIKAEKLIAQYDRDSGRVVRRRTKPESSSETTVTSMGTSYGQPTQVSSLCVAPGSKTRTTTTTRTRWGSFAFTYYLVPSGQSKWSKLLRAEQLASKLFGLRLTPALVWQLAPWSWAADWVTNIGPVIKNWSAFTRDGLVMRYGYVMETIERNDTFSLESARFVGGVNVSCSQTFRSVTKKRNKATPFGFGLNPNSFTARQWSIIGALGISRVPGALR